MSDKQRELIMKIYNLAQRGIDGEKEGAQRKLEELLKKNNMTLENLNQEKSQIYTFVYHGHFEQKLLLQVIYKVMGAKSDYRVMIPGQSTVKLCLQCTAAQKVEIDLDFDFYKDIMNREMETFYQAFIQKQMIFPNDAPHSDTNKEMTDEERERLLKQLKYSADIDKETRYQRIGVQE